MKEEKILTFRTCKEGFEKLVSEWKCEYKYREVKKFWESRLLLQNKIMKNNRNTKLF